MPDFIYLASQSPRRSQLLQQLGVRHELLLPNAPGDVAEDAEAGKGVAADGEAGAEEACMGWSRGTSHRHSRW